MMQTKRVQFGAQRFALSRFAFTVQLFDRHHLATVFTNVDRSEAAFA
jgi:hypothetical protein